MAPELFVGEVARHAVEDVGKGIYAIGVGVPDAVIAQLDWKAVQDLAEKDLELWPHGSGTIEDDEIVL
jgi:hypothetical protein